MWELSVGGVYVPSICHPWVKAFGPLKRCTFYLWGYTFSDEWLLMLSQELVCLESESLQRSGQRTGKSWACGH